VTLLAYRLRPLPGTVVTAMSLVLLAAAWWLGPRLGEIEAVRFLQLTAALLGLATAFTVSRDVDPPKAVLAAAPHPYWRTPALRVSLWVIAAGAFVGLIGHVMGRRALEPLPVEDAVSLARTDLVLVAGLAFVLSTRFESFLGGAATLAALVACAMAQRMWGDWPLRVLDTVGMPRWGETKAWLLVAGSACLLAGVLYLRAGEGTVRSLWGVAARRA
jgi:hypothetical protein